MKEEFKSSVWSYLESLKWGEYIIVEHGSSDPTHLLFYVMINQLKESNIPFVIIDVLDKFYFLRAHLTSAGIDTSMLEDVPVIKLGGIRHIGKITSLIERIEISQDTPVWIRHYRDALRRIEEKLDRYVKVVVGIDSLLQLYENNIWELNALMLGFASMMGDKSSKGVVFLNSSVLNPRTVLKLEEIFPRVLKLELKEGELTLRIEKSADFDEHGREIKASVQELQDKLKM
ncbi:MAG TPA: hypothetical protein ENF72_01305 [Thermococcus litoralis]|uniref:KaiC-like domain-containing protein n=1 Tax=Thermococcus litoralis TaxID=2265 RepID=A0A7C0TYU4_THELI|nr:MAG: hypothetical protein DRN32_04760 [Thermococci archaeon]HDD31248.1 hypothetical protein [Thermococcus litoralis]